MSVRPLHITTIILAFATGRLWSSCNGYYIYCTYRFFAEFGSGSAVVQKQEIGQEEVQVSSG